MFPVETSAQRGFIAVAVLGAVVVSCTTYARVKARQLAARRLDHSDYLMIAACVLMVIYEGINISGVLAGGLGFHATDIEHRFGISPPQELFVKHLIAFQSCWCIDLTLAKVSILTLYIKVFDTPAFILFAKATMVLTVLWMFTMLIGSALICQPIAFYWDPHIPGGFCGNFFGLWLTTGILNVVTDLLTLLLPMPYLYRLDLTIYKKMVLMMTFGLGMITVVVSIIRLNYLMGYQPEDAVFTTLPIALLSALEPALCITLGCIPLLRPLFSGTFAPFSRKTKSLTNPSFGGTPQGRRAFSQLEDVEMQPQELDRDKQVKNGEGFDNREQQGPESRDVGSIAHNNEWQMQHNPGPLPEYPRKLDVI